MCAAVDARLSEDIRDAVACEPMQFVVYAVFYLLLLIVLFYWHPNSIRTLNEMCLVSICMADTIIILRINLALSLRRGLLQECVWQTGRGESIGFASFIGAVLSF